MATTAAIIARARRDIISHFLSNDSVSPERAILCVPDRGIRRRALERLVARGVVVQTAPDTYYLSAPAYDGWLHAMRRRLMVLAGVVIALAAAGSVLVR